MTESEREELELLAGQFALGTLEGEERARFERLLEIEGEARAALARWEDRLAEALGPGEPVDPPEALWRRIEQSIAPEVEPAGRPIGEEFVASLQRELRRWRMASFGAAAAALALALYLGLGAPGWPLRQDADTVLVALLQPADAGPSLLVDASLSRAVVRPLRSFEVPAGRSLELWAIEDGAGAPRSLGLLNAEAPTEVRLPPAASGADARDLLLAVSLEPLGGSPTGAPTGEVLFTGRLQEIERD